MAVAQSIIGVDTLWGGDVENPSGLGRFIADSYFSGKVLPSCYSHPVAEKLRAESEGVMGKMASNEDVAKFVKDCGLNRTIDGVRQSGLFYADHQSAKWVMRSKYLVSLADSLDIMLRLALAVRGMADPVPYEEAVMASTGQEPKLYDVSAQREQIIDLMEQMGKGPSKHGGDLYKAVQAWRQESLIDRDTLERNREMIDMLDDLTVTNVLPHLPVELRDVARTNIGFILLEDAWFSGSLNYHGRERDPDGNPLYEASYELNAKLEMSSPEFLHLISHEVVPGHIMNYALLHYLYHTQAPAYGFETTIQTMNSRASTLAEGIANNAMLFAHGVRSVEELEDPKLRLGVLLSLIQDYAKANISYRTYVEMMDAEEIAKVTMDECLLSGERAKSLSSAWAKHPLMGVMYMPSYAVGTELVANLLKEHGPEKVIPAVYGALGPVDVVTVQDLFTE